MLSRWKNKFPTCFRQHATLCDSLSEEDQTSLSIILSMLNEAEPETLNEEIINHLVENIAMAGLSRAVELSELAQFKYDATNYHLFILLTNVFANPLCRLIYDARLRCFSDYATPSEPISTNDANAIILQLAGLEDEENRIRTFFDFYANVRPFPCSQKYIVDIDINELVGNALIDYCTSLIEQIQTQENLQQAINIIQMLREAGGNKNIFDEIKYTIAYRIESDDLCSTRRYDDLMNDIWLAVNKPQNDLPTFSDDLKRKRKEITRKTASRNFTLFQPDSAKGSDDITEQASLRHH